MSRMFALVASLLTIVSMVGCGAATSVTMPDVSGKKLDVAYKMLKAAGFDEKDKIIVEGGGAFGVVKEANWTVCKQFPAAGQATSTAPTLTVSRSCDDNAPGTAPNESRKGSSSESTAPAPSAPPTPAVLTVKNNKDLAELLDLGDECSSKINDFATKYSGQRIEFDGAIVYMAPHGHYKTRFDILVNAGAYDPDKAIGPNFQFSNQGYSEMHLTGERVPDNITAGQNYTFIATLGSYNPGTCLYQLSPVETMFR